MYEYIYIYVWICIYICVYICIYICIYMYIYICIYICINSNSYMYYWYYMYWYVLTYVLKNVLIYVSLYYCTNICINVCTNICINIRINRCMNMCVWKNIHTVHTHVFFIVVVVDDGEDKLWKMRFNELLKPGYSQLGWELHRQGSIWMNNWLRSLGGWPVFVDKSSIQNRDLWINHWSYFLIYTIFGFWIFVSNRLLTDVPLFLYHYFWVLYHYFCILK